MAPEDLRWLLALTGPRIKRAVQLQSRLLGIDPDLTSRSTPIIERAIAAAGPRTRAELGEALAAAGIEASAGTLAHLLSWAELEAVVCSGPRRGRTQTYALVDQVIPPSRPREREEALAEIARRYVEGHGPAQAIDLAWWAGLTVRDARRGLETAGAALGRETIGGRAFWSAVDGSSGSIAALAFPRPQVRLLPNYDEMLVAFRDRTDGIDSALPPPNRLAAEILNHVIVRDGLVVGGWRRGAVRDAFRVNLDVLVELDSIERQALVAQVERLSAFLGRPVAATGLD